MVLTLELIPGAVAAVGARDDLWQPCKAFHFKYSNRASPNNPGRPGKADKP